MTLPWEEPDAPEHVRKRQPVCELLPILNIPGRHPVIELAAGLQGVSYGVVIMTHRGSSNGRLALCLSTIPANFPVVVASDSVDPEDVLRDRLCAEAWGATFSHLDPWGGRAANAIHAMKVAPWDFVLYLCDDVWLFPETVAEALRWTVVLTRAGLPLATLGLPIRHTRDEFASYGLGFESWQDCFDHAERFNALGPVDGWQRCPSLFRNPFGACMVINRRAYEDLGGFAPEYWAHDDVWNHKVWLSGGRWVNAAMPGRGFVHFGGQSWHHGESEKYVGSFKAATGMTADESGAAQAAAQFAASDRWGKLFTDLGGTPSV